MKLLGLTDLHGATNVLERILTKVGQVDLVLLGGDVTNFGTPDEAEALVATIRSAGLRVLAVAGNCDSAAIDARLVKLGVSLSGRGVTVGPLGLHGLPAMPPWLDRMYHFSEPELADLLAVGHDQIAGAARHAVLSHAPPRAERIDRTRRGQHVGSTALREFIDRTQPELVGCGHIHEARGVETLGRTTVVNCGAAVAGAYALIDLGQSIQVELGAVA